MNNVKKWVYEKLTEDTALVAALGGKERIQFQYPDTFNTMPVLTYSEVANNNQSYFDNKSLGDLVTIQIDLWATNTTSTLKELVDDVLSVLLFNRDYCADVPNIDDNLHHTVMRYSRLITADDLTL